MAQRISRREFVSSALVACGSLASPRDFGVSLDQAHEAVIDIHQHTHYAGRTDEDLVAHQDIMGVARTVLLPAGSKLGLDADCYGNESVFALHRRFPDRFVWFANEAPDLPDARAVIEKYLRLGACGIGEQKFPVECDGPEIGLVAEIAREFDVPVLLHFQHNKYNTNFLRFHKTLEKYPQVRFIGHAQTWWGNIDRSQVQEVLYPKGPVTSGGYTDRLLSDYANMFGDLSAGSGLNALQRDEEHARGFLMRHRKKLMYGSDCDDRIGGTEKCSGSQMLATLHRLVADKHALVDILAGNARRVIRGVGSARL